ncbi:helix-turn-helix domain-containing protein [Peribacillus kribbensis]|uniref:helix-turn-helix domain-containing protein n=1 Tax=Peribacillus kribbensis TaxID=356658 RepID=UPI000419FB0A|nr:helix-turn-helix transcriptional regulator [Peribacillus kribbensis]
MPAGRNIKYHRIRKSLTQEELATGIISISYLSKIENEQITASPEIIESLYKRLGIEEGITNDSALSQELQEWYQTILDKKTEKADELFTELEYKLQQPSSFDNITLFDLISIRYYLTKGLVTEAENKVKELSSVQKDFNKELLFYYYKFHGNLFYTKHMYSEAYEIYKSAESLLDSSFSSYERADIFYSLGLSAGHLYKPYLAILYTNQALEIFQKLYLRERSAECHLLLGISFKKVKEYDEAETHYKWAGKLAEEEQSKVINGIIQHNLGQLSYVKKQFSQALKHFRNSLQLKEETNVSGKLMTLIAIMNMCYEFERGDLLEEYLYEAEKYTDKLPANNIQIIHEYKVFHYLVKEDFDSFVFYCGKVAIPYFKKNGLFLLEAQYAEILASYYKKNRKYKQSSYYYEYAQTTLKNQIINI